MSIQGTSTTPEQTAVDMLRIAENVLGVSMRLVSPDLRLRIGRHRIRVSELIEAAELERDARPLLNQAQQCHD